DSHHTKTQKNLQEVPDASVSKTAQVSLQLPETAAGIVPETARALEWILLAVVTEGREKVEAREQFAEGKVVNKLAVLSGSDTGSGLTDKLSERFCPHLSNSTQLSACRRDKFEMMEQAKKHGIRVPDTLKANSVDDILNWVRKKHLLPQRVIIKPLNSTGGDGVKDCFNEDEIIRKSLGRPILLAFVKGKHVITAIWERNKEGQDVTPAGEYQQKLAQFAFRVLDAVGVKHGPAYTEFFLTDGEGYLIETCTRNRGGVVTQTSRAATGSSQIDWMLNAINDDITIDANRIGYTLKQPTWDVYVIVRSEGQVTEQDIEAITEDLLSVPAQIILSHMNEEQIKRDYEVIRKLEEQGLFNRR
ncbi:15107_t:CDS:2, partial [Acaulospora morrowiae]